MYVRVRIEQAVRQDALTVPQRAVTRNEAGQAQVYVLAEGNKAELRPVTLGQVLGSEWVVETGLEPGETVIADGVQKVQPGATVAPEPWKPDAPADTSAAPADASASAPAPAKTAE